MEEIFSSDHIIHLYFLVGSFFHSRVSDQRLTLMKCGV
jgi:hypothetical protein